MNAQTISELKKARPRAASPPSVGIDAFLQQALRKQWRGHRNEFKRCRRKLSHSAVHQLRVSIRRLFSTLDLLSDLVGQRFLDCARRALARRLRVVAKLRDTHSQLSLVARWRHQFKAADRFRRVLRRRERRLDKTVRRNLSDLRRRPLARAIAAIDQRLPVAKQVQAADQGQLAAVQTTLRAAHSTVVTRSHAIQPGKAATLHRARVAFKKYRYMMEVLQPLLPEVSRTSLASMQVCQTQMGDIQDVNVLLKSVDKFMQKHQGRGKRWKAFRAGLRRRRTVLFERFMRAPKTLLFPLPRIHGKSRSTPQPGISSRPQSWNSTFYDTASPRNMEASALQMIPSAR